MKKTVKLNIVLFILILLSEVFNLLLTSGGTVQNHYFVLVEYNVQGG